MGRYHAPARYGIVSAFQSPLGLAQVIDDSATPVCILPRGVYHLLAIHHTVIMTCMKTNAKAAKTRSPSWRRICPTARLPPPPTG